jgi:5-methylcytosine-specific restriction protein A
VNHAAFTAPRRPCNYPGCRLRAVAGRDRCERHGGLRVRQWSERSRERERIRGRPLQRKRADLFEREPLCRLCVAKGRTTEATIRDHITPLAEGGTEDESNIQPICDDCNRTKTAAEAQRGRGRTAHPRGRPNL